MCIINNKVMKMIKDDLVGQELTIDNINNVLYELGFKKLPNVTIQEEYKPNGELKWVTLKIIQNSIRITLDENNKVINDEEG